MLAKGDRVNVQGKLCVAGDIHGEFGKLNAWISKKRPAMILQCGDLGYWPRHTSRRERKRGEPIVPKMGETKLYWADGNHEDHDCLKTAGQDNEVFPNVFYMKRGSVLTLDDGRSVLFMGGAESQDKEWRIEHESDGGDKIWFAEERTLPDDVRDLPDRRIDIIVSHAAPREFNVWGHGQDMIQPDPSRLALSAVLHRYKQYCPLWFFGHYHARIVGQYQGVHYFGLNMIGCSDWWMPLAASKMRPTGEKK